MPAPAIGPGSLTAWQLLQCQLSCFRVASSLPLFLSIQCIARPPVSMDQSILENDDFPYELKL